MLFLSTFNQAGLLVRELVARADDRKDRDDLALATVRAAEPLDFAAECLRWITMDRDDAAKLLSAEGERSVGTAVAGRVRTSAGQAPVYRRFPEAAPHLLWIWREYGSADEVAAHLRDRFHNAPEEALEFVGTFAVRTLVAGAATPRRGELGDKAYSMICSLVDPAAVVGAGEKALAGAKGRNVADDERTFREFVETHGKRRASGDPGAGEPFATPTHG